MFGEKRLETGLNLLAFVVIAVFLYQMYREATLQGWILTDVIVISFGIGFLMEGIFIEAVMRINRREIERGGTIQLGKPWLFVGLLLGITVAGLLETITSSALLSPSVVNTSGLISDTFDAISVLAIVFYVRYWRKPKAAKSA